MDGFAVLLMKPMFPPGTALPLPLPMHGKPKDEASRSAAVKTAFPGKRLSMAKKFNKRRRGFPRCGARGSTIFRWVSPVRRR